MGRRVEATDLDYILAHLFYFVNPIKIDLFATLLKLKNYTKQHDSSWHFEFADNLQE